MSRSHLENFSEQDAKKSWDLLEEAITKIYEKKYYELSYEELYRYVYFLVLHRHGDFAYQNVEKVIHRHLKNFYHQLPNAQNEDFLNKFNDIWVDATEMLKAIARIFLYMDKNYIMPKLLNPIKMVGYQVFLEVFFRNKDFNAKFKQQLIGLIRNERNGMPVDRILLKNLLSMLIELSNQAKYVEQSAAPRAYGAYNSQANKSSLTFVNNKEMYQEYFERNFLQETEAYYAQESEQSISAMTATEYLHKAEKRCQEELDRVDFYLDISTKSPLIDLFMDTYINRHSKTIVDMDGLCHLFENEKHDEVRRLYRMFLRSEASRALFYNALSDFHKRNLNKILEPGSEESKDPIMICKSLIEFHKKSVRLNKALDERDFERAEVVHKVIKDVFETHINKSLKTTVHLNVYLDQQFREGLKCLKDTEVETILNEAIDIFKYITNKDVFEKYYKNFLSKRLLQGKSLSEENEKLFTEKLQAECGSYFTAKIEIMFKDIALSSMITSEFHTRCAGGILADNLTALDIRVLTTGNWPLQESSGCNLPREVKNWTKLFEGFYAEKYTGRKIQWVLSQGTAELRASFAGKKKEFLVTSYQMCILLMFNNNTRLTVKEILAQTMIPEEEVCNNISAFLSLKLVKKTSGKEGNEVTVEDAIELNEEFVNKSYRIKMPIKKIKEKAQDGEKNLMEVLTIERKYWIEACIVRIMKSRKRLEHAQLIEEVLKLITLHQFRPDIPLIKKVIEELIAKDYIDRTPENKHIYVYIS